MLGGMHMGRLSPSRPGAGPLPCSRPYRMTGSHVAHTLAGAQQIGYMSEASGIDQKEFRCVARCTCSFRALRGALVVLLSRFWEHQSDGN